MPSWSWGPDVSTPSKCVHSLFEEQAQKTPDAIAVEHEGKTLTYQELDQRSNQLAHYLRNFGVGPNVLVGISLDRSLEVIIGIYAILKAGGAYVPIDPGYPAERIGYMIAAAKCPLLLTQEKFATRFNPSDSLKVILLDADWQTIAQESPEPLPATATLDDLIYIIFTSGSTGKPKAAAVYHRGFTNLIHWFVNEFAITEADNVLLISSLSFDLTQKNLYAPLLRGGKLHLYPPGAYDIGLLLERIHGHGITLLNCTPSAFYPLIEPATESRLAQVSTLRVVFLGGEPISVPRLRPWLQGDGCRAEVANTYGPTECTDICGFFRLNAANMAQYESVPLGRPVYNVQLAIVDEHMKPCPVGTSGELCIAGAGIGKGYINDAALTATKFIPNPFAEFPSELLYRTGDQVRWMADGTIEFLGRLDHQTKIRGFRIELHEIESALNSHPGIREAIVIVHPPRHETGDPSLACFFTSKNQMVPERRDLRTFLGASLPEYMIPESFVSLIEFPLSPNGKVDRKALAILNTTNAGDAPVVVTSSKLESQILAAWKEILHHAQIGLDDNFFDLGGNSIALARLHTRLQEVLSKTFPLTRLFEHASVRAQTAHFSADGEQGSTSNGIKDRMQRQRSTFSARRELNKNTHLT